MMVCYISDRWAALGQSHNNVMVDNVLGQDAEPQQPPPTVCE